MANSVPSTDSQGLYPAAPAYWSMADDNVRERGLGVCQGCGEVSTVRILADGSILPYGTGNECPCGCCEFQLLEKDDVTESPDDE